MLSTRGRHRPNSKLGRLMEMALRDTMVAAYTAALEKQTDPHPLTEAWLLVRGEAACTAPGKAHGKKRTGMRTQKCRGRCARSAREVLVASCRVIEMDDACQIAVATN